MSSNKAEWPELVGKIGDTARTIIREEGGRALTQVAIFTPDMMGTCDYRTDRVRIYVDENGVVNQVPRVG